MDECEDIVCPVGSRPPCAHEVRPAPPAGSGGSGRPRVVVMDNASLLLPKLAGGAGRTGEAGPPPVVPAPHGPERNDIERTFHKARLRRVQPHPRALTAAVQACFQDLRDELVSLHLSIRNA